MSSVIAIPGSYWGCDFDYEPVTEASRVIQQTWAQKRNYLQGSASDWIPTIEASLRAIKNECANRDWDRNGANPVSDLTISLTENIIEILFTLLARNTPVPDITPESDGEICISWSIDVDRLFALSVGPHGKVNFSGQFGKEGSIHGWKPVDATSRDILEKSLQDIAKHIGQLHATPVSRRNAGGIDK